MRQAARRTRAQAARAGARGLSARASLGHPRLVELGCAEPASGAPSGNVDMYMLPSMSKCLRAGIQRPVTDAWRRRAAARAHTPRGCAAAACDCGVGNGARSRRALATQAGALQRARALRFGEMAHLACAVRRLPGDAPPGGSVVGPGSRQTGCLCESDARGTVCGRRRGAPARARSTSRQSLP